MCGMSGRALKRASKERGKRIRSREMGSREVERREEGGLGVETRASRADGAKEWEVGNAEKQTWGRLRGIASGKEEPGTSEEEGSIARTGWSTHDDQKAGQRNEEERKKRDKREKDHVGRRGEHGGSRMTGDRAIGWLGVENPVYRECSQLGRM